MNIIKIAEEQLNVNKGADKDASYENHDFDQQINFESSDAQKIFDGIKFNHSYGVTDRCLSEEVVEIDNQQQSISDSQQVLFLTEDGNQRNFVDQQQIFKFNTYTEFKQTLAEYEAQTITKFILRNQSKQFTAHVCLHDILRNEKNYSDLPMIRWEFCAAKDFLPIPFMGIPYITVGKQVFQCHQGKDYNTNKKQQYELKKEILNQATRIQIKSRNKGPSKKLDCPVLFAVRKLYFFPEYPLENDTKRNRALIAQNLRAHLAKIKLEKCVCVKSDDNYENIALTNLPGKLEFLTRFPPNNEHNHSVAKAASFIKLQMKKLVSKATENTIKKVAEVNPFQYDKHVELITALRQSGDLDQLRTARENMANVYPLSESMWLEWFSDELPLAILQEHKEYLLEKFDLAVKDYTSVKLWHEYCQFVMNNIESPSDIERARSVFERAITAVGLHVAEGSLIWDGYREFEMAILDSYQQLHESGDTIGMEAKVDMQIDRIQSLFKRQLSVPLLGMSSTFKIYEDWLTESIPSEVHRSYERALQKLSLCTEYEEKLKLSINTATNVPSLKEYLNYINYEIKDGDPARIQSIFERAIKDHCLEHELWIKYLNYLDYKLKIPDIALVAHVRSVRNCPWVSSLWVKYINALERSNKDYSEIKEVFNQSLKGGFSEASSYLQLWLADCDYHRRKAVESSFESEKVDNLRQSFEEAITYMNQQFGLEGDKDCVLMREWAFIEAKYLNNVKRGQELWDTVMKKHSKDANMWLEYINFLMLFTDPFSIRRVFQRAIQISFEQPEQILAAFIQFERRYGSLTELDDAQQKVDAQMFKIKEKKEKEALNHPPENIVKNLKKDQVKLKKKKKKITKEKNLKRSNNEAMEVESPIKKKKAEANTLVDKVITETAVNTDFAVKTVQTEAALAKTELIEHLSTSMSPLNVNDSNQVVLNDGEQVRKVDNECSIFISNLLFSVDENHIKDMFEKCGDIDTIRIVKNRAGKSKGYAYLQFKSKLSVDSSLLLDRESILGRPMFVSRCVDKQNNPTKFKFPTQLDKHTLYVSNLPFEMTADQVTEHFSKIGKLKQVRLVTNRSGKSKGYAYVEYESETDAQSAIVKLDQVPLNDRPINVSLSNPPARKITVAHEDKLKIRSNEPGVRGRSKTQISMVPRSLQKNIPNDSSINSSLCEKHEAVSKDKGPSTAMSNEEFRKFLLKH
ncbi:squamous cell carcinoma antigen recognized by T-cells 3 isoform X3 [Hydra vulgaris]|uniref:Squamous cell carcinoma antigen recognized by T-cells 3 isoform X3 n=1 Tax=Hydra vulgaris TaxID=6087 RepID=A0ABM4CN77_HYDVU